MFKVYGDSGLAADETPKNENDLLLPGNPYAATKANFFSLKFKHKSMKENFFGYENKICIILNPQKTVVKILLIVYF